LRYFSMLRYLPKPEKVSMVIAMAISVNKINFIVLWTAELLVFSIG